MKILLAQVSPMFDADKNAQRLLKIVRNNDADLYIFPELYLTGYLIRDEIMSKAIRKDAKIMKKIVKGVGNKTVIFGFPERDDFIYNSAAVIIGGNVHIARKLHLPNFGPFEERLYFREGEEPLVVDSPIGKIGVQICYDIFFPEIAKKQALEGANFIVNISASPITSRNLFEKIIPARAIENTVFFIYVNWAGTMRTMVFWGGSQVHSPRGELIYHAPYFEEKVGIVEINPKEIDVARNFRPTLRDTREFFLLI